MELIQYWHDTKVAKENPIRKRTVVNPPADDIKDMLNTIGAESMIKKAQP
jgi:hypothetical protein